MRPAFACCFVPRSRCRTKPADDAVHNSQALLLGTITFSLQRLHANGELPQIRQQRTRTEHENLKMIILERCFAYRRRQRCNPFLIYSVKRPEAKEPPKRSILAALPPLLVNGGMRRGDISVISESEKIVLSQVHSYGTMIDT